MRFHLIFIVLFLNTSLFAQTGIEGLFSELIEKFPEYGQIRLDKFVQFCNAHDLDSNSHSNKRAFFQIYFLHDLFTGESAQNYSTGGILQIPYFWHWVEPNPRYGIIFLEDSVRLGEIPPPEGYEKYKSYADIDRIPYMYLMDLLADRPKYYHEKCSSFYTFGWCSEREMAFNALLEIIGYNAKIKQSGIHTWSEILISFRDRYAVVKMFIFKVDNTFDRVDYEIIDNDLSVENWRTDVGSGSLIEWYNRRAHSPKEIAKIKSIQISATARNRIEEQITQWLETQGAVR